MKYVLKPLSIYELGQRANQEDSIYPEQGKATADDRLFVLCDGMGGHDSGEVASQAVCQAMSEYVLSHTSPEETFSDENFNEALSTAYDVLDEKDNEAAKKMGTTMTFLKFHRDGCLLAHIGDSRIYHIRPSEKEIRFKTRDHSLVNDLMAIGEITPEEAKTSKQKNVITRAMQPHLDRRPKADIKHITDICPGDYFFLCSDGMLEETEDSDLLNILSDPESSDEEKLEILIKVSENNKDNHSAYLIHVLEVTVEEKRAKEEGKEEGIPETTTRKTLRKKTQSSEVQSQKESAPQRKRRYFFILLKAILFLVVLFLLVYIIATKVIHYGQKNKFTTHKYNTSWTFV